MKTITTHASAATVYRWATQGSKRVRAKYRHAETVCLVLNRREAPIMGTDPEGNYGRVGDVKVQWGYGHFRECGPADSHDASMRHPAKGPPWDNTESMTVYREEASPGRWAQLWRKLGVGQELGEAMTVVAKEVSGECVPGSVSFDASTNTATLPGTIADVVINGTIEV